MKYSRNNMSRFIPILLVIVITLVVVAAVIAIGQSILGGGQQTKTDAPQTDEGKVALLSSDISRSVRLTVRGPIVADESFRSYQIVVGPTSRTMTTFEGYLEKPIETKKLENNKKGYEEFVFALDKRKMMDGRQLSNEQNDLRGVCASGKIYEFETLMNGQPIKKLWTSDCDGAKGSALAKVEEIVDMFLNQIPDGRKTASKIGLVQEETFFKL